MGMFTEADAQLTLLRHTIRNAGGLIVAPNIETANKFRDELQMLTQVHLTLWFIPRWIGHLPSSTTFRNSSTEWLISVDMITEGVDITTV